MYAPSPHVGWRSARSVGVRAGPPKPPPSTTAKTLRSTVAIRGEAMEALPCCHPPGTRRAHGVTGSQGTGSARN